MGGGKRSKHKNLHKAQQKANAEVRDSGKVREKEERGDVEKGFSQKQASSENANATAESEVIYVANSDEELMETSKCDENDNAEDIGKSPIATEDTKEIKGNHEGGGERFKGKGKKLTREGFDSKPQRESNLYSHPNKNNRSYGSSDNREGNNYQTKSYRNRNYRHDEKSRQSENMSFFDDKQLDKTENSTEETMVISHWDGSEEKTTSSFDVTEDSENSSVVGDDEKKSKVDAEGKNFNDHSGKGKKSKWGRVGAPSTIEEPINQPRDTGSYSSSYQESNRSRQSRESSQPTHYRKKSGDRNRRGYDEGNSGRYRADSFGSKDRRSTSKPRGLNYDYWSRNLRYSAKEEGTNVNERFGDLFAAPDEYSLAHCVAEDMNMGSGIATTFRSMFKRVDELLQQRVTQGGVAVLQVGDRYIYYLVTKRKSSGKPTYETLFRSLCAMRSHVEENEVTKLAMPRIGCGLDGLEWRDVKSMLQYIFHGVNIDIVIYNFQQENDSATPYPPKKKCAVKNVLQKVVDIEQLTIILYPCSVDRYISEEMRDLDEKFNIIRQYDQAKRTLGSVIRTDYRQLYLIYGVVVREKPGDLLNYQHFQTCISEINKLNNKKDHYWYVAMQGFEEERDQLVVSKLVNLMRNTFYYQMHVYICWPKHLEHLAPRDAEYY